MYSQETLYIQMTFHYMNGQSESFNLYAPVDENGEVQITSHFEIRHILKKEWWVLHLPDQSVFVNVENVVKLEVKPPMVQLQGEDVFANAERVTALNRSR